MKVKRNLKLVLYILFVLIISSCKEDEYVEIEPLTAKERAVELLKQTVSADSIFSNKTIGWEKINLIEAKESYKIITVPVYDNNGNHIGEVMFEGLETELIKKYLSFDKSVSKLLTAAKDSDINIHKILNLLETKQNKRNLTSRTSSCVGCHTGNSVTDGIALDEVVVTAPLREVAILDGNGLPMLAPLGELFNLEVVSVLWALVLTILCPLRNKTLLEFAVTINGKKLETHNMPT